MKGVKSLLLKRNLTEQEYKYSLSTNKMTSRFVTIFSLLGLYQASKRVFICESVPSTSFL